MRVCTNVKLKGLKIYINVYLTKENKYQNCRIDLKLNKKYIEGCEYNNDI